jgi:membrane associated rhomboid family serine protease
MITFLQDASDSGPMQVIMAAPVASFIFAITIASSIWAFYNDNIYENMILHPYSVARGRRVYTLITSGLIHADVMHLMFNMLSFYFFAFQLEGGNKNLGFAGMGHWQFAVLYVVSLILSDIPSVYKHRNDSWYHSLGASGAISAVIFSFIMFNPITGRLGLMFLPGIDMPAIIFGVLYLFYCNYMSKHGRDNINHDAHFFGALSGMLITVILFPHSVHNFIDQVSAWIQSFSH